MAEIAVTVTPSGEAYVSLVVGDAPAVRHSVALDALEAAETIPALDGLVLDFDYYGRVVGLRVTGAADSSRRRSWMRPNTTGWKTSRVLDAAPGRAHPHASWHPTHKQPHRSPR
jgi:hypothetical protein